MSKKTDGRSSFTFEPLFVPFNQFLVTTTLNIVNYRTGCALVQTFTLYEGVFALGTSDDATW